MSISMMSFFPKSYKAKVNLRVMAGVAKPNPKMGQSLGPLGVNMMQFCKDFNAQTGHIRGDVPLRVTLIAYPDRTYTFQIKPPATSWFIKKAAAREKGSELAGHLDPYSVSIQYLYEVSKIKQDMDPNLKEVELEKICRMVVAQTKTMGINVIEDATKPKIVKVPVKL